MSPSEMDKSQIPTESKVYNPSYLATLPTIEEILKHNPKSLVLLSHLGRPNGQRSDKFTLKPVMEQLSQYLNRKVTFLDDCVGEDVISRVQSARNEVFLCENVRFHME